VEGEFKASLTTVMAPVAGPVAVGEKTAASERVCPGERLALPENPLTLKLVPLAANCEMLMVVVPELAMVNGKEPEVPTRVLLNVRLPVLTESREPVVEDDAAETPVPDTETLAEPQPCLIPLTTMLPVKVAAELTVFTGTEPKLMELGETPTPARTVAGKSRELTTNRHTHRVLFIPWHPSYLSLERFQTVRRVFRHAAQILA